MVGVRGGVIRGGDVLRIWRLGVAAILRVGWATEVAGEIGVALAVGLGAIRTSSKILVRGGGG